MNIYDFDKTVFYPDSSVTFYRYCLRKRPGAVWPTVPRSLSAALRYRHFASIRGDAGKNAENRGERDAPPIAG